MDVEHAIDNLLIGFHEAVDILCSSMFLDPYFNLTLHGYGFNGCAIPTGVTRSVLELDTFDEGENLGLISNYGSNIYYTLKSGIAVKESSSSLNYGKKQDKFVFYLNETDDIDKVELTLSSKTFGEINQEFGDHFKVADAVTIRTNDESGESKFTFNSALANNKLCSYVLNLSLIRPKILLRLEPGFNSDFKIESYTPSHLGDEMQGLKSVFSVFFPEWPDVANGWISRKRMHNWPSGKIIKSIADQGVSLIPTDIANSKGYWKYSFHNAEKILLQSLSENLKLLYKMVIGLIEPVMQITNIENSALYSIFTHALFWFIEDGGEMEVSLNTLEDDKKFLCKFLNFLLGYVSQGNIPHYFIPSINLLANRSETCFNNFNDTLQNLVVDDLLFMDELLRETSIVPVIESFMQDIDDESKKQDAKMNIVNRARDTLVLAFKGTIKLFHLSLCGKLNRKRDINSCIEYHQLVIEEMSRNPELILIAWAKEIVSSSLANLYLADAAKKHHHSQRNKNSSKVVLVEIQDALAKAEHILKAMKTIDIYSGKVQLANLYYMDDRYQECLDLCEQIQILFTEDNSLLKNKCNTLPNGQYSSETASFLNLVCTDTLVLDLVYAHKFCLPRFISENLRLTTSSLLGMNGTVVYILDADIICKFLHAMSLQYLNQPEVSKSELVQLESLWNKTQGDSNERRNIAYLNAIAMCYLENGYTEDGVRVLNISCQNISGPSNPGRITLLGLKFNDMKATVKQYVFGYTGLAIGVSVMAVLGGAYRYMR